MDRYSHLYLALTLSLFSVTSSSSSKIGFEARWCPYETKNCDLQNVYVGGRKFKKLSGCNNSIKHLMFNNKDIKGECIEIRE
jgi:hypothetical protein